MKTKITKYYYGDFGGEEKTGGEEVNKIATEAAWPLWEVFIRSKQGLDHKHAGSLHALIQARLPML